MFRSFVQWRGLPNALRRIDNPILRGRTPHRRLNTIPFEKIESSLQPTVSLGTANQKQITNEKIHRAINNFRKHEIDTGSSAVQIAVLTEKILNLARHFAQHRKDHHSKRGFQSLISRRRQLMKHLRRTDFDTFAKTVKSLKLEKEAFQLPLKH